MRFFHWLLDEAKLVLAVTFYFAACFTLIMLLKELLLAEYGIAFSGITTAIIVALITAKVVIVLQKVPLSRWFQRQPAILDVAARTVLYGFATLLALLLEKAFDARAEYGGFLSAIVQVFEHRDVPQIWATTIWVGLAFAAYNAFGVLRREIGAAALWKIFFRKPAP